MSTCRFSHVSWLQTEHESKFLKTSFYTFGYYLNQPCTEIWRCFLNFDRILAIENFKKHMKIRVVLLLAGFDRTMAIEESGFRSNSSCY
jgi:hypothetical protein